MSESQPILLFEVYRWAGTTTEEFKKHYHEVHAQLGKKLEGIIWYETFFNENPTQTWQAQEAPRPDAFVIMQLESEDALDKQRTTENWRIAKEDDIGFASHSVCYRVTRVPWILDKNPPTEAF